MSTGNATNSNVPVAMMWDSTTPMTTANVRDMRVSNVNKYIQKTDGTWHAVGQGQYGALCNGASGAGSDKHYPVAMKWSAGVAMDSSNVKRLLASYQCAYLLRDDGIWYAVGYNIYGQLSNGTSGSPANNAAWPVAMKWGVSQDMTESSVVKMAMHLNGLNILRDDDIWYAVGINALGQLSDGTTTPKSYPVKMLWSATPLDEIDKDTEVLSGGSGSTYLVKDDGSWWAVGRNDYNGLSDGTTDHRSYPVAMKWSGTAGDTITDIPAYAVGYHSLYLQNSGGDWYSLGYNAYGQLSQGTTEASGAAGRYPARMRYSAGEYVTAANTASVRGCSSYVQLQRSDGSWWAAGYNAATPRLVAGPSVTGDQFYPVPMKWADGTQIKER
jgi:alpha-tubulin suppressor-like RCC1 family protein